MTAARIYHYFFIIVIGLSISAPAKNRRPPIDPLKQIDIIYGNPSWNTDPAKIDEAFVVIRDVRSKKIVTVSLFENGPDESVFTGKFMVSWGSASSVVPEVYIPESAADLSREAKKALLEQIKTKSKKRKPFILTRGANGQQVIEVFDTRSQAKTALINFRKKIKLERAAKIPESVVSRSNAQLAAKATEQAKMAKLKQSALDAEAERIRLTQLEEKEKTKRLAEQKALAKAEQERRKKLAKKLSDEAISLYQAGEFQKAEDKFKEAVNLDPENKSYYFAYGATLYSNKKYNKAIVVLNSVDQNSDVNPLQRDYFLGLSYQRVNDFENSVQTLERVRLAQSEPLSSSASFYKGMAQMGQKKWPEATKDFQWVLDNSKDPRLDERAEEMIEKIARMQQFENNQSKVHLLSAGAGLQYDSNVLLQAENATNSTASNQADFRITGLAGYEYRPIFTKDRQWSVKSDLVYIYSLEAENAKADPMVISLSSPYVFKGKTKSDKAYKSEINTKIDMIYMDPEEGKTRENILDTYGVDWNYTIIQSEKKFTKYRIGVFNNNSHNSTGDDNSDGINYTFGYSNTYFLDKKAGILLVNDNAISLYDAKGINQKYYRLDTSATYLRPLNWKSFSQIMKVSLYYASYPDATDSGTPKVRNDLNIGLNYLLSKPLNKTWNFVGGLTYTKNDSSYEDRSYSKFVVMSMLTGNWQF